MKNSVNNYPKTGDIIHISLNESLNDEFDDVIKNCPFFIIEGDLYAKNISSGRLYLLHSLMTFSKINVRISNKLKSFL